MERLFPPVDPDLSAVDAAVTRVTVLEDRAQVRREGQLALSPGRHRLIVHGVSPILQNVSLQAAWASPSGRVADVRAGRAWRVRHEDRPEEASGLERAIEEKARAFERLQTERREAQQQFHRIQTIVEQAVEEIPIDAAWNRADPETWTHTFDALFSRIQSAAETDLDRLHQQEDLRDTLENLIKQRAAIGRLDTELVGWIAVDLDLDAAETAVLSIEYVVPCAIWRPVHTARWPGGATIEISTSAMLWQNTGEDWSDVALHFSTSRASLGHEPPRLQDDALAAERKDEDVHVEIRQVEVAEASIEGADGQDAIETETGPVALAGVDDGGQRRHLIAEGRHSVPSDGRPVRIPLGTFEGRAEGELITMPEQTPVAVWRVVAHHNGRMPLLAGPVELVRRGPVGWTDVRFVAEGAPFELGFGPDDAVRIERTVRSKSLDRRADEWPTTERVVRLYLSNLDDEARSVKVIERIWVSEVDEVRIALGDDTTTGYQQDEDGFITWTVELGPRATKELKLTWMISTAPDVDRAALGL